MVILGVQPETGGRERTKPATGSASGTTASENQNGSANEAADTAVSANAQRIFSVTYFVFSADEDNQILKNELDQTIFIEHKDLSYMCNTEAKRQRMMLFMLRFHYCNPKVSSSVPAVAVSQGGAALSERSGELCLLTRAKGPRLHEGGSDQQVGLAQQVDAALGPDVLVRPAVIHLQHTRDTLGLLAEINNVQEQFS